ncbi:MAG: tRNA pseudouridine(38-40) synthase TruA [Desulfobacterales bacterium]|nr:tRNA pseudouridine(38-40) synthase TruA [Desulfobacterales bacterium]
MTKNFKLIIEYDGSLYHGWQRQKDDRSIQGEIEKALQKMTTNRVTVIGSGRTDAGVHAEGQVASFKCDTRLEPEALLNGLNSLLAEDTVIKVCEQVSSSFHARFDAKSKIYHYKILNRPTPAAIGRKYSWLIRKSLNQDAMRAAISHIIGRHDFKAFEGTGSPRQHTTRQVYSADLIEQQSGLLVFHIEADGFLRYMVRNIVGTLVDVGMQKLTSDDFKSILDSKDRSQASATAPAHGLTLIKVIY